MEDRRGLSRDAELARRFQRQLRSAGPRDRYVRPDIQYDESGYPVERRRGLAARVRQLITG